MNQRMTALERAFQLARSGQVSTVSEIKASLSRDGYSANQLDGPSLRRQLTGLTAGGLTRSRPTGPEGFEATSSPGLTEPQASRDAGCVKTKRARSQISKPSNGPLRFEDSGHARLEPVFASRSMTSL